MGIKKGESDESADGRRPIAYKPIALDGGYGWIVVLGSFLIHVFADGFVYSFGVIAESLVREFQATNAEVSTILSLLTGLMLATGPVASAICNRIGCRITTIIGAIIASIGCAISYKATSMTYLIISVGIIMGIGFGFMYCPAIVIVTMYFERYRSLATGVTVCGAGVGTFVFSKIIAFLIVNFDWRTVFLIYAALVLLCVPCGAIYRPIEFEPIYENEDIDSKKKLIEQKNNDESSRLLNGKTTAQNGTFAAHKKNTIILNTDTIPEEEGVQEETANNSKLNNNNIFEHFEQSPQSDNNPIRSSISQVLVPQREAKANIGNGVLQRFRSLGEHLHIRCGDTLGTSARNESNQNEHTKKDTISVSTGYLNIKDVFYNRSVTALPDYVENQQRFRSISSLHSTKDGHAKDILINKSASIRLRSDTVGSKGLRYTNAFPTEEGKIEEEPESNDSYEKKEQEDFGSNTKIRHSSVDESVASNGSRAIEIWRTLKRLMDLSLLVNPIYLLFAISNFLTSIGFNAPPMFMPMNAESVLGFSKHDAASTVSAYGLANLFGRIAFGLLCDRQLPFRWGNDCVRNRLWIYNWTLMLCGIASCFVFLIHTFPVYAGYCFFFGFTISSYVCLTSVVLVDLVGVDRLTNAFGLLLFIQGIATFVGPPIAGQLYDLTRRYDWTFAFCGICLFISGIMMFAVPYIQQRKNSAQNNLCAKSCSLPKTQNDNVKTPLV